MFRIKENPDGSVSIFSNDEKQEFICAIAARNKVKSSPKQITEVPGKAVPVKSASGKTLPAKTVPARSCKNKKENVPTSPRRPQLSPKSSRRKPRFSGKDRSIWPPNQATKKIRYRPDDDDDDDDDDIDVISEASFDSSASSAFSFASKISIESSTEPDEDCLDQPNFCRMLDLVESKRLRGSKEEQLVLKQSFPIRKIACQVKWQDQQKQFRKLSDNIGFSCLYSRNVLNKVQNPVSQTKDFLNCKYEKFCNNSVSAFVPLISSATPLLRTRDVKARYPVTYKKAKGYIHEYTFNKKQRKRRANYLNLGLSEQSFLLKLKCRKCFVRLERLSRATISRYCNPPSKNVHVPNHPKTEFKSQKASSETSNVKLTNGKSLTVPVVCLSSENLVTNLLRKFGPAQA